MKKTSKKCPNCGYINRASFKLCHNCGVKLKNKTRFDDLQIEMKVAIIGGVITFVTAIVAGVFSVLAGILPEVLSEIATTPNSQKGEFPAFTDNFVQFDSQQTECLLAWPSQDIPFPGYYRNGVWVVQPNSSLVIASNEYSLNSDTPYILTATIFNPDGANLRITEAILYSRYEAPPPMENFQIHVRKCLFSTTELMAVKKVLLSPVQGGGFTPVMEFSSLRLESDINYFIMHPIQVIQVDDEGHEITRRIQKTQEYEMYPSESLSLDIPFGVHDSGNYFLYIRVQIERQGKQDILISPVANLGCLIIDNTDLSKLTLIYH